MRTHCTVCAPLTLQPNYYTPDANLFGSSKVYEDDGRSLDYLAQNGAQHVWTSVDWEFKVKTFQFTARIVSAGHYNGFEQVVSDGRSYGIRVFNIFPPRKGKVLCNGQPLAYDKLTYRDTQTDGTYYYDGETMSLTVNCARTRNVFNATAIEIEFADSWIVDINVLDNMRGKVNRAFLAKSNLDRGAYGDHVQSVPNGNLTRCASYMTLLNAVGDDYESFKAHVGAFEDMYNAAIQEVKALDPTQFVDGEKRVRYSLNLLSTIAQ